MVDGRYELRNDTGAPLRDVHVRRAIGIRSFSSSTSPARGLLSNDQKFGYRIYRFDRPLAPGATDQPDLRLAHLAPRFPRSGASRRTSSKTAPS